MTPNEVIDLLTVITAGDRRTVGEADVEFWAATVGDLDFTDARDAVLAHFRDSNDWLKPKHVRDRVAAIRKERLDRANLGPPSEDPDVINDPVKWLAAVRSQIADAASPDEPRRAIGGGQ